jgi:D-serine deaminase-like pyridoxal phosphate-dependent protein
MVSVLDLDTPCVVVDENIVRDNIFRMQSFAVSHNKKLRPHIKTHKVPLLAEWQIEAGASGICVQKTSEAEVMVRHGIKDVFISNEVIGEQKTDRVAALGGLSKISLAVDSELGVSQISKSASEIGTEVGVFIDVDVGMERCGVRGERVAKLAELITRSPGIYFSGVMGYDGHTSKLVSFEQRKLSVKRSHEILKDAISWIASKGISVENVSVGGTPSSYIWAEFEDVTELQPGTYLYNDAHQVELGVARMEECGLTVLSTVMSKPTLDRAIIDAGSKSFAFDQHKFPVPLNKEDVIFVGFSEEHGVLRSVNGEIDVQLGEKIRFIPYHVCTTVDLWDYVYLVKDEKVIGKLNVEARGMRT